MIHPEIDSTTFPDRLIVRKELNLARQYFPEYDWQLDEFTDLGSELYGEPVTRISFRSNLAKVSVKKRNGKKILWDEGFFDMVLVACITAVARVEGQDPNDLHKETIINILRDGGARLITLNPHLAIVLQEAGHQLREGALPLSFSFGKAGHSAITNMFRLVRNFCILHEIGHLAEVDEEQNLLSDEHVATIRSIYSSFALGRLRMAGGSNIEEHQAQLNRAFEDQASLRELRADIYAMSVLFPMEYGWIDRSGTDDAEGDKVVSSLLLYHGLAILHYVQSNILFMKRFSQRNSDGTPYTLSETPTARMQLLRGDVRLFLASRMPHQYLSEAGDLQGDEKSHAAFQSKRGHAVPDFSRAYLELSKSAVKLIARSDRDRIFREEDILTEKYGRNDQTLTALRNMGWID